MKEPGVLLARCSVDIQKSGEHRKVAEGENFHKGDEYHSGYAWHEIPEQWIGMKLSYHDNNTLSRMQLPVRRKVGPK